MRWVSEGVKGWAKMRTGAYGCVRVSTDARTYGHTLVPQMAAHAVVREGGDHSIEQTAGVGGHCPSRQRLLRALCERVITHPCFDLRPSDGALDEPDGDLRVDAPLYPLLDELHAKVPGI